MDIVRGAEFKYSTDMFMSVLKSTSRHGKGSVEHKLSISQADINRLYQSMAFDPNTQTGLMQKVWLELCMFFCRRGRENQRELSPEMFECRPDENDGRYTISLFKCALHSYFSVNISLCT